MNAGTEKDVRLRDASARRDAKIQKEARGSLFGQIRTRELRNSARIVQTARFAFSLVTRSIAHICAETAQDRETSKVGSIPVARLFTYEYPR
jgi:hypothetical protein